MASFQYDEKNNILYCLISYNSIVYLYKSLDRGKTWFLPKTVGTIYENIELVKGVQCIYVYNYSKCTLMNVVNIL
jgi:hypothetical protein